MTRRRQLGFVDFIDLSRWFPTRSHAVRITRLASWRLGLRLRFVLGKGGRLSFAATRQLLNHLLEPSHLGFQLGDARPQTCILRLQLLVRRLGHPWHSAVKLRLDYLAQNARLRQER